MAHDQQIHIECRGQALAVSVARRFGSRLLGLMGHRTLASGQALLLPACRSVHTCFMRFALDLAYLDRDGCVVKTVSSLPAWRLSFGGRRAAHTLEMAQGSIARFGLQCGDRLAGLELALGAPPAVPSRARSPRRTVGQDGASMIEFAVVGPLIALLGLGILQYGMLFFARNQINHAAFMATRAGSMAHADLGTVQEAFLQALLPLYGGGRNAQELAQTRLRVEADLQPGAQANANFRITMLNPTRESFNDWNDPALQARYGARAIPNGGMALRDRMQIGPSSGQNIQDANLIKLHITHGYQPKVPLVGQIYSRFLQAIDSKTDPLYTRLVDAGRIPVQTEVMLQMQSDVIEQASMSVPGPGNPGQPGTPGDSGPDPNDPSTCTSTGCAGNNGGNAGGGLNPGSAPCPDLVSTQVLSADLLFEFGKSALSASGQRVLDQWIASNKDGDIESITLTGYTDPLARPGFDNMQLSLDRAESVRAYLQSHGLANKPIRTQGMGADKPVVELDTCPDSGQAQIDCLAPNRRVEINVTRST